MLILVQTGTVFCNNHEKKKLFKNVLCANVSMCLIQYVKYMCIECAVWQYSYCIYIVTHSSDRAQRTSSSHDDYAHVGLGHVYHSLIIITSTMRVWSRVPPYILNQVVCQSWNMKYSCYVAVPTHFVLLFCCFFLLVPSSILFSVQY